MAVIRWILCNVLGRHRWAYRYRDFTGIRSWPDGSWSNGPDHLGNVCRDCQRWTAP